jgi:dTDP-4-amino-4,6-dideoxy-D-glucose/dTDP-4-amino-2,4-dideoxy-beta-L-xylose transaminase
MIPLFKVRVSPHALMSIEDTLKSGFIAQGPRVDELEGVVHKELNLGREPIAVNSATSALELALDLAGVGPGDEVISTPMTCYATNVGILRRGATIVWADVYPTNGNINIYDAERLITNRTKAIMAVDWAGQFAEHGYLKTLGPPVIEDAAHVWDVYDHDMQRGDFITYSLQAIKFLTAGDGGLLVTPDDETHKLARMKRWYGLDRDNNENFRATQDIKVMGTKWNMNDISASLALANISQAKNSVYWHRRNALILTEALSNLGFADPVPYYDDTSYWVFPLIMRHGVDRDAFEKHMNENGIQTAQVHFRNDKYSVTKEFSIRPLPGLDYFADHQTNIPCGWWLTDDDLAYIIDTVKKFGRISGA